MWLSVVAPHIDTKIVMKLPRLVFASGNELVSFPCPRCGAVYCDPVEQARQL